MQELFIEKGQLVSEETWKSRIQQIQDRVKESNSSELQSQLQNELITAITSRANGKVGILFSGGIDSTFIAHICKKHNIEFTCYTVGFQDANFKNPEDVDWAKRVAKELDFPLKVKVLNLKDLETVFKKTTKILGNLSNVVNVGVGSVVVAALEMSKENIMFSGLGSEEIFAGYERHKNNPSNAECWNGLYAMYQRDLLRDAAIAKSLKRTFATPFLDVSVIEKAMQVPIQQKIDVEHNKKILRNIARSLGLPKEFAERKKRAAQYGSSFDRALQKLATINHFKYKKEYIDSLKQ